MLVLLPPSEGKTTGGSGGPLDLAALVGADALTPTRQLLVGALLELARDPERCRAALGLSAAQSAEVSANAEVTASPTTPALRRYSGVLYDALAYASLPAAARRRADAALLVQSALLGVVRATDPVPAYRLSAGSALPDLGTPAQLWRGRLDETLRDLLGDDLLVDLRSGAYAGFWRPGRDLTRRVVQVRVVTEREDGSRVAVSHFSKAAKGGLARALVLARRVRDRDDVLAAAEAGGLRAEPVGATDVVLVTDPVGRWPGQGGAAPRSAGRPGRAPGVSAAGRAG